MTIALIGLNLIMNMQLQIAVRMGDFNSFAVAIYWYFAPVRILSLSSCMRDYTVLKLVTVLYTEDDNCNI